MNAENELRRTELVEAGKRVTIVESQLRNVRDELDQSIAPLKQKEQELYSTRRLNCEKLLMPSPRKQQYARLIRRPRQACIQLH